MREELGVVQDAVIQDLVPHEDREREGFQAVCTTVRVDVVAGAEEGSDFVDDMLGVRVGTEQSTR